MIGYIVGKVGHIEKDSIILMAGSIGYEVILPLSNLITLKLGQEISAFVHTHVREDQFTLFGFFEEKERTLFRKLISVSGVGPKSALAILSVATPSTIVRTVETGNADLFPKVPGVGRKTIEKIILELKNTFSVEEIVSEETPSLHDARLALETLGYSHKDISSVINDLDSSLSMNEIIRQALQILSKTK